MKEGTVQYFEDILVDARAFARKGRYSKVDGPHMARAISTTKRAHSALHRKVGWLCSLLSGVALSHLYSRLDFEISSLVVLALFCPILLVGWYYFD